MKNKRYTASNIKNGAKISENITRSFMTDHVSVKTNGENMKMYFKTQTNGIWETRCIS